MGHDGESFGVAGHAYAHAFIGRGLDIATRVAGSCRRNSLEMFEDRLDAPKAAASKNSRLLALGGGQGRIYSRSRDGNFRSFRRPRAKSAESRPADAAQNQEESNAAADIRALHGGAPTKDILAYSLFSPVDAVRWVLDGG